MAKRKIAKQTAKKPVTERAIEKVKRTVAMPTNAFKGSPRHPICVLNRVEGIRKYEESQKRALLESAIDNDYREYLAKVVGNEQQTESSSNSHIPLEISALKRGDDDDAIYKFLKDISNVDALIRHTESMRILNRPVAFYLGRMQRDEIEYARMLLINMSRNLEEIEKARKAKVFNQTKIDRIQEFKKENVRLFLSRIHLIGLPSDHRAIFSDKNEIFESLATLDQYSQIERTVRLLSGASLHKDTDSIRYIQQGIQLELRPVRNTEDIWKNIVQYVKKSSRVKIAEIIEITDNDPYHKYEPHCKETDQIYLWHPTRAETLLADLKHGLRSTPVEEIKEGNPFAFTFWDTFAGCEHLCKQSSSGIKYKFLCQVSPGQTKYVDDTDSHRREHHTLLVKGKRGPNRADDVVIDGIAMPCGNLISQRRDRSSSPWNKYITQFEERYKPKYIIAYNENGQT